MGDLHALNEMDAWCKRRAEVASQLCQAHLNGGGDLFDAAYRANLGKHQAYMAMRSFVSGMRTQSTGGR